ncbi:hypothetical protein FF2_002293 [Malus domestica]
MKLECSAQYDYLLDRGRELLSTALVTISTSATSGCAVFGSPWQHVQTIAASGPTVTSGEQYLPYGQSGAL